MNHTTASPPSSCWVQLYIEGQPSHLGIFEIVPTPRNVSAFRDDVKEQNKAELEHCSAALLKVYPPGTAFPIPAGTAHLIPWGGVPTESTGPSPIIVVAPAPQRQQQQVRLSL